MIRGIEGLPNREFDLVVVGGGIFGACVARDAALRGLSVVLFERGDFGQATSANSYKLAHGGMRYLQQLDLPRVWESSHERSALIRVAPHLVYPLPILMPTYGHGLKGKELLRAAFAAYDLLTVGRNRGIADQRRRIPPARFWSREEVLRRFPKLPQEGLTGGAVFCDGQIYNTPRLTLAHVRSAVEAGGQAVNYAEVVRFLRHGRRVCGVEVRDLLTGRKLQVRSQVVINSAGPWAARLVERNLGLDLGRSRPVFSRDVYFVTRRVMSPELGIACQVATRDAGAVIDRGARHLFIVPWRGFTLVGVWHGVYAGPVDDVRVSDDELQSMATEANLACPGLNLTPGDVGMVNTGLILFGDERQNADRHDFGKRSLLLDHASDHGIEGLLTLIGVRATVARGMAERAVDRVFQKLGRPAPPCRTKDQPVYGGAVPDFEGLVGEIAARLPGMTPDVARSLAHNYGCRYRDVLNHSDEEHGRHATLEGASVLRAEVVHAVREEMAVGLGDVVLRRTDLGSASRPTAAAIATCADLMCRELGWDRARTESEVAEVDDFFRDRGAVRTDRPGGPALRRRSPVPEYASGKHP